MNETPQDRLRLAFDLFEFGLDMQQCKLARQLEELLIQWLQFPITAPHGDCEGRILPPSRFH